jgi:antitoxin (DNA-binding transcriptional repressor) of toxin-antitoxin stability system
MKFVTVRDFRSKPAQVWKDLNKEHEMIVTLNGKPVALMTPITEKDIGNTLSIFRRAKAIDAVNAMQFKSMELGNDKIDLDEINKEINKARRK